MKKNTTPQYKSLALAMLLAGSFAAHAQVSGISTDLTDEGGGVVITDPVDNRDPLPTKTAQKTGAAVPGEYIVVLKKNKMALNLQQIAENMAQTYGAQLEFVYGKTLYGFSVKNMSEAGADQLANDALVDYVIQNSMTEASAVQDNAPWNLDRLDQVLPDYDKKYEYEYTGAGVHAYLLDSGVRHTHSDFAGRVTLDMSVVTDAAGLSDCNGHGTHIAGVLGGQIWGVAKQVRMHSVKVLDCEGKGTASILIAGLEWVMTNAQRPAVLNISLTTPPHSALDAAVARTVDAGLTVVTAAGNRKLVTSAIDEGYLVSPAREPKVISVGATDENDRIVHSIAAHSSIDIWAPGVRIRSASHLNDTDSVLKDGTSQAAAHVSGLVAQYLETHPNATPQEVRNVLEQNGRIGAAFSTYDEDQPFYRLDYLNGASHTVAGVKRSDFAPLYRFVNRDNTSRHFYWTQISLGFENMNESSAVWYYEGLPGFLKRSQDADNVPLYHYHRSASGNNFYTTDWNELGGGNGDYEYHGITGYCSQTPGPKTTPLYRYYHGQKELHFYTQDYNELGEGRDGWHKEGIACHIYRNYR
ncbi:S8 family serine peptidase [Massilia sp. W12]|uniref:S8 family serine peptidase n=1 Tax=Massilia sp. W12 TaxID=3126507 RepID=UPI0030D52D1E